MPRLLLAILLLIGAPVEPVRAATAIVINEVDTQQAGDDAFEFVEIAGPAGAVLDGYRLVLFNGNGGDRYAVVPLDGQRIPASGLFVVGAPGVDRLNLVGWHVNGLQNAGSQPDAIALYRDDGRPGRPTATSLVDVVVYGGTDSTPFRTAFGDALLPPPSLLPIDGLMTSLGRTAAGWSTMIAPSPGWPNDVARINEVVDGGVELIGVPGASLSGLVVRGDTTRALSGTLPASGLILVSGLGGAAIELRRDGIAIDSAPGTPAGRIGSAAARFQPVAPTPNEVNLPRATDQIAIGAIRGPATAGRHIAALVGRIVTISGTVTAHMSAAMVTVQDGGDGDDRTSDAIAVRLPASVPAVGDSVRLTGRVSERDGWTTLDTVTDVQIGPPAPLPEPLRLTGQPWGSVAAMRVRIDGPTMIGPRHRYGDGDTDLAIQGSAGPIIIQPLPGSSLPAVRTGDRFAGILEGVALAASVGVAALPPVASGPSPADRLPPIAPDRDRVFSIATLNVQNLFDRLDDPDDGEDNPGAPYVPYTLADYRARLNKLAMTIAQVLHAPEVIALQEIEDQDRCTGGGQLSGRCDSADGQNDILADLTATIASRFDLPYQQLVRREGADARGIVTALLIRTDRVRLDTIDAAHPLLGARPGDPDGGRFPLNQEVANPKVLNAVASAAVAIDGEGDALFSRPPIVAGLRVRDQPIVVIANHFKSEPGDFRPRRTSQASYVAALAADLLRSAPNTLIVVAGDFNVDGASPQVAPLARSLFAVSGRIESSARYSYVLSGVADLIDQIHASPALAARLQDVRVAHVNADWPDSFAFQGDVPYRTSDHDPVIATFGFTAPAYRISLPALIR